jgi:hypothetical protein
MRELEDIETIAARVRIARDPVVLMGYLSPGDKFEIRSIPESPSDGVRTFTLDYAQTEFDAMQKMRAKQTINKVTPLGDDTLILEATMTGRHGDDDFAWDSVMIVTIKENKVVQMISVRLATASSAQDEMRRLMPGADQAA